MTVIRKLGREDVDAFIRLRMQGLTTNPISFGSNIEEEQARPRSYFEEHLAASRKRIVWGAFREGKLVGTIRLVSEGRAMQRYIYGMYVSPDQRGRGIGRRLLKTAVARALRSPSVKQIWLDVEVNNAPALGLYRSMGFRECGITHDAYAIAGKSYSEYIMRKFVRSRWR